MHTTFSSLRRCAGLVCAGALLLLPTTRAFAGDTPADAFPDYDSYIKVGGQASWINGDPAAFANQTGTPVHGSAGIEDFYYSKDLTNDTTVTVNGHALGDVDDYLASVKIETDKVGTLDLGYSTFRTFYDGVGGFFPLGGEFFTLQSEDLHVDRGTFWVNAKLARPNAPVFTVSYKNSSRTGMKDSSEWAPIISPDATIVKGKLVGNALPANTRYIGPNVMTLDEHRNTFDVGITANIGSTTEDLKLTVDEINNADGRGYVKYPGSTVIADPTVTVQDDYETIKSTAFHVVNTTDTKISDKLSIKVGLQYQHLAATDGGAWVTPTYNATFNKVYTADTAVNIYGNSHFDDYTGNIALDWTPTKDLLVDAAFRAETDVLWSNGGFTNTTLPATAKTITAITTNQELTYSNYSSNNDTPELTIQYSGFKNLTLYIEGDQRVGTDQQHWVNPYAAVSTTSAGVVTAQGQPPGSVFYQEADQNNEDLKFGANWNACAFFTARVEVYQKDHQNQFIGSDAFVGTGSYGGYFATGYNLDGAKISLIVKPLPTLSFNTRYQPQAGTVAVTAATVNGGNGNEITSGRARTQMISESLNWNPTPQYYVQANINLVYSYIQTAYPLVVVSATTNIPTPIQNANNNYITESLVAGAAIDKKTDADVRLSAMKACNYNPQIANGGQPYGSSFDEQTYTVGLKHQFNGRLRGEVRGGYMRRTDATTGYFTNFDGPLAYVSLTYAL
jgi:hypothetical protein